MNSHVQPCWTCKKCAGQCSWSKKFKPIKGWTAEPHKIKRGPKTFRIYECPEYEFEPYTREMTIDEIAEYLNTSKKTVFRYIGRNIISQSMFIKRVTEREKENERKNWF